MHAIIQFVKKYRYELGITAVILLAAFMRFYQLNSLPPGLHPDEAANGLDIFKILENHDYRPFYSTNGGREALFFYLQSIGVSIFGNTILGLRVAPALIGTLSVGAVYLWIGRWFGRRTGLIAALLMAVTPWGITISRDGFRAGMVALMVPLTLWLYTRTIQSKGKNANWWAIAAGVSLGAGFYTYLSYKLFPLAILAAIIYAWYLRREQFKKWLPTLVISLIAMAVTLVPMGIYGVSHPADVLGRAGGVSFLNPDLNHGQPVQTLAKTIEKSVLMFNFKGDENYRQNLGGQPEFNIFVGVMFILGSFITLVRLKQFRYFGILMVFGVGMAPEVLTAEGIPHALRAIGALPAAVGLAAIGISYMLDTWYSVFPLNSAARAAGTTAVCVLLALTVYQGYVQYFVAWANSPETYEAYSEDTASASKYLIDHPTNAKIFVIGGGYGLQPLEFLTHNHLNYTQIEPKKVSTIPLTPGVAKVFVVFEGDKEQALKTLKLKFPNGHITPIYSNFNGKELYVVYTVPAS